MPNNIIKSFADKTGKSTYEIEDLWDKAKAIVKKKTSESDEKFYPTTVHILKKMLNINEDVATGETTSSDIAVVPKRLGEKPLKQASLSYDGNLNGFPYFSIKEVGDWMKVSSAKRMNQKIQHNDERINRHLKENGGPFLLKHGDYTIKLSKKDF